MTRKVSEKRWIDRRWSYEQVWNGHPSGARRWIVEFCGLPAEPTACWATEKQARERALFLQQQRDAFLLGSEVE